MRKKECDSLEKDEKPDKTRLEQLKTEIDFLADDYLGIIESLEEYDYQERFIDDNFDFSSISDDLEFRKEYFSDKTKRKEPSDE